MIFKGFFSLMLQLNYKSTIKQSAKQRSSKSNINVENNAEQVILFRLFHSVAIF